MSSDILTPLPNSKIAVPSDSCEIPVTINATARSPGGEPNVTVVYIVDKSGSTDDECWTRRNIGACLNGTTYPNGTVQTCNENDGEGDVCLESEIIKFFDRLTDAILSFPSTKNVGVITFAGNGTVNNVIQTTTPTNDSATIKAAYDNSIVSEFATCCGCAFNMAYDFLDNNRADIGNQVIVFFLSDGLCNRPPPRSFANTVANSSATRLIEEFDAELVKIVVGNVDCSQVSTSVPPGLCFEETNPANLNLTDILGTKLISGTITVAQNGGVQIGSPQTTVFPDSNYTIGVKQDYFDWMGTLGLGTYDVNASAAGADAETNVPKQVDDIEVALFEVVDRTPPKITCPADIDVVSDNSDCTAVVHYHVTSNDNCPFTQSLVTTVCYCCCRSLYCAFFLATNHLLFLHVTFPAKRLTTVEQLSIEEVLKWSGKSRRMEEI